VVADQIVVAAMEKAMDAFLRDVHFYSPRLH
jgi:hypothetical protein